MIALETNHIGLPTLPQPVSDTRGHDIDPADESYLPPMPWRKYGLKEAIIKEFCSEFTEASMGITSIDITVDGLLENERSISDKDALWALLNVVQIPASVLLRVLVVKDLSAEALQIMGVALGMSLDFWSWVVSDQGADRFWLNTNDNGRVISFDMPCFEFYKAKVAPATKVAHEGRTKQLSTRHRFFGSGLTPAETYDVYLNRRVSGYLVPMNGYHILVFISENCQAASSLPLYPYPDAGPPFSDWLLLMLKNSEPTMLINFNQEPVGLILVIMMRLLSSWHSFTNQFQRDLDEIDGSLPESLPSELPQHNLYDIGTYLHRDVVQTVYRFTLQLGKYERFMKYLCESTTDYFRPKRFIGDVGNVASNVLDVRRRLEVCKDRANMSLTLINNYISLQQARLSNEQALIAAHMALIQTKDSHSASRLSIVATVFLPLSFATSWLSTNSTTPLWVFVVVAAVSMLATMVIISGLKWLEQGGASWPRRAAAYLFGWIIQIPEDNQLGIYDARKVIDRSLLV